VEEEPLAGGRGLEYGREGGLLWREKAPTKGERGESISSINVIVGMFMHAYVYFVNRVDFACLAGKPTSSSHKSQR